VAGAHEALKKAAISCPGNKELAEEFAKMQSLSATLAEAARLLGEGDANRALELYTAVGRCTS
jgi:hypothetical protein